MDIHISKKLELLIYQCHETHESLEKKFQSIKIYLFDEEEQYLNYVKSVSKSTPLFLILPYDNMAEIVHLLHSLRQVDSIFLYCSCNDCNHEYNLLNEYSKIINILHGCDDLTQSIQENIDLAFQQADFFKFYEEHQKSTRDLSKEAGSFLWLRIFKDVVLQLPHDQNAKNDLIDKLKMLYRNNRQQLNQIDAFDLNYESKSAIRWYTLKPFLYKQLNRALRTEDIESLHSFRYFIYDLSKELENEFKQQREDFDFIIHLYRGVHLSKFEVNTLESNIGKFLSTNGYLSTSENDMAAQVFAESEVEGLQAVVFDIEYSFADISSVTVASIAHLSEHRDEQEFLFDFDSTFVLECIEQSVSSNSFKIKLKAVNYGLIIAEQYIEQHRKYMNNGSVIIVFGFLLIECGEYEKAEKYFAFLLKQPNNEDLSFIHYYLGLIHYHRGDLDKALSYYETSYKNLLNVSPVREGVLPFIMNDITVILKIRGEYDLALVKLTEALTISDRYTNEHITGSILSNMANIYAIKGETDRALEIQMEILQNREQKLPSAHKDIAKILISIAKLYVDKDQLDKALEYSRRSLDMNKKCLPPMHLDLASSLHSMGTILMNQGKYEEAFKSYSEALKIRQNIFPKGHITLIESIGSIGKLYYMTQKYEQAFLHLRKALNMHEEFLPNVDNTSLIDIMKHIGLTLIKQNQPSEALFYFERTLKVSELIYPAGHRIITDCLTNLGITYSAMEKYDEAFDYFRRAQDNQLIKNENTDPIRTARLFDNMGLCLCKKGKYIDGLNYRMKAVRIIDKVHPRQQYALWIEAVGDAFFDKNILDASLECYLMGLNMKLNCLPEDDVDIGESLRRIGDVYVEKFKVENDRTCCVKAIDYYDMALNIYRKANSPSVAYILNCIGSVHEDLHNYEIALKYFKQASSMYENYFQSDDIMRKINDNDICRLLAITNKTLTGTMTDELNES